MTPRPFLQNVSVVALVAFLADLPAQDVEGGEGLPDPLPHQEQEAEGEFSDVPAREPEEEGELQGEESSQEEGELPELPSGDVVHLSDPAVLREHPEVERLLATIEEDELSVLSPPEGDAATLKTTHLIEVASIDSKPLGRVGVNGGWLHVFRLPVPEDYNECKWFIDLGSLGQATMCSLGEGRNWRGADWTEGVLIQSFISDSPDAIVLARDARPERENLSGDELRQRTHGAPVFQAFKVVLNSRDAEDNLLLVEMADPLPIRLDYHAFVSRPR